MSSGFEPHLRNAIRLVEDRLSLALRREDIRLVYSISAHDKPVLTLAIGDQITVIPGSVYQVHAKRQTAGESLAGHLEALATGTALFERAAQERDARQAQRFQDRNGPAALGVVGMRQVDYAELLARQASDPDRSGAN